VFGGIVDPEFMLNPFFNSPCAMTTQRCGYWLWESAMSGEIIYDRDLARDMIPTISDGHAVIGKFAATVPDKDSVHSKLWKETNTFRGELRSITEARNALCIVFRALRNELVLLEEDPELVKRVDEILEYLRSNLPSKLS
jgi:hypothetical protein